MSMLTDTGDIRVVDIDTGDTLAAESHVPTERAFQLLDLAARRLDLLRRIRIAKIRLEYGMLTAEKMDDLIIEGAELKADVQLWKAYR